MSETRIFAPWLAEADTQEACACLTRVGFQALFVGGSVRNALMGKPASDIDIATDATPEEVMAAAERARIRTIPTGVEHGTVTLMVGGEGFEVTSFRRDVETDGRRAVVAFTRDIREDAERRDLTMNALYADPSGRVIDPLGTGLQDVRNGHVRFVGDAGSRIREDALRMMRFFRFAAAYGHPDRAFDQDGLAAITSHRDLIGGLSRERVTAETVKILGVDRPGPALAAMEETGVLAVALPDTRTSRVPALLALEEKLGASPSWRRRAAALGITDGVAQDLRLSKTDARHLSMLRAASLARVPSAELGYRFGAVVAEEASVLAAARLGIEPTEDFREEIARGAGKKPPVTAAMLPGLQGPALGAELKRLEALWVAGDFRQDAAALLGKADAARPARRISGPAR